jgi:hypothetical protein
VEAKDLLHQINAELFIIYSQAELLKNSDLPAERSEIVTTPTNKFVGFYES